MKKTMFLSLVCILCATNAWAQYPPQGGQDPFGGRPPQRESAEVRATRKTQQLRDTLKLDSDQFDQVYKVYYSEYAAMEQSMPQGGPGGGMPPGGGPGGMPPQGGGGPQGGGMPPQGFGGPQGGGMPPQGMEGGSSSTPKALTPEQLKKQQEKRQKKMKKILTPEQYELWFLLDTQPPKRPNHPNQPDQPNQPA